MPAQWHCTEPACFASAVAHGSAKGLRAIGWFVDDMVSDTIKCPSHHPDQESKIASTAVIQYVLEHHYDTFLSLDTQRRLTETDETPQPLPPLNGPMPYSMNPLPGETWLEAARRYIKETVGWLGVPGAASELANDSNRVG